MTDTPRLRSAFPPTPRTPTPRPVRRDRNTPGGQNGTPSQWGQRKSVIRGSPTVNSGAQADSTPLIPFDVVDAPSQRLYVAAFYIGLNAWRIYEYWTPSDGDDATWLFLKWLSIDAISLFGLSALRIPWLEWAFSTTLAVFLMHAVANMFLMFRIPIPIGSWLAAMVKVAYDRELSISERRVKPADILHNSSLILGKHIIHILPEGSATLNPDRHSLCLDDLQSSVTLPIRINQTKPISIELLRFDLDSGYNETIVISGKQMKQMKREADKARKKSGLLDAQDLHYEVRKTGVYKLKKVVDESKLEVQGRSLDTLVVSCPKAVIRNSPVNKCKGELSNLILDVEGTPPFKIKYSRRMNDHERVVSFQSIQPENFRSPLLGQTNPVSIVKTANPDLGWAMPQKVEVPLNESLRAVGEWTYSIEEVHDGSGNAANYTSNLEIEDRMLSKTVPQMHQFSVHEMPRVSLSGCNSQKYLQAAKGESIDLPVHFHSSGPGQNVDAPYTITYSFVDQATNNKEAPAKIEEVLLKNVDQKPKIKESGWYKINAVSSQFCSGEVFEPSSCFLHNPAEPQLAIRHEKVYDTCANNSVGILVYLDLIGTPPFKLRYTIEHSKGVQSRVHTIDSLRGQLDLRPTEAGVYKYKFIDISDRIYEPRSLKNKVPVLEQDVKPPASAHFVGPLTSRKACFGEPVSIDVSFLGEAPWELQYEVVHNGKRTKYELQSETEVSTLVTNELVDGGIYTLGLTSVKDRSQCKRALKEEIKIEARPKRPRVSFGYIDKERSILALEDKKIDLPLRLEGEAPWKVTYRNALQPSSPTVEKTLWNANSIIQVSKSGQYEIVGVSDATCPGSVDGTANVFNVSWIPRPRIIEVDGTELQNTNTIQKDDVCEGDENTLEMKLDGNRPYSVRYEEHCKPDGGASSVRMKSLTAALNSASVQMDTSKSGSYSYKFIGIGDNLYSLDNKQLTPLVVTQRVNPRPSANFASPNHVYGFCKEKEQEDEVIPVTLEGVPPFALEIGVRHHSSSKQETLSIPNINSHQYNLALPRRYLDLGQYVINIRKVRDARGCQRTTEYNGSSVRVTISDVPTIIPLDSRIDYCVGERISFSLSGHAPFEVYYTFDGVPRKAKTQTTSFRRIAEKPGEFTITSVGDGASGKCKGHNNITRIIHEMPSVRISRGGVSIVDIPEGGEAEIVFEFWGTPPFEFTYTRSSNSHKGAKSEILDTKHDISYEHTKSVKASDEGTYEVVAIKDQYCSFSTQNMDKSTDKGGKGSFL